jgi:hypothetical protein
MPPKKAPKKRSRTADAEEAPRGSQGSKRLSGSPAQRDYAPEFADDAALKPLRATIGAVGFGGQDIELVPMSLESEGKTIIGWHGTFRNVPVRISDTDTMFATALVSVVLPTSL